MSQTWKTIRVFISSTFRDMHAERDHLVKRVFPQLRERLEPYRIHLVDIDLRWGVTAEQADNDMALDLCLQQIDECRPFFVGILGQRYGWVPKGHPADAIRKFGWIQHHTGKSVTELEILHGVLQDSKMRGRAFFYFRDPAPLLGVPQTLRRDVYMDASPVFIHKLEDLKRQIRYSGYPVMENYPARWDPVAYDRPSRSQGRMVGLEAFGERVRDQLWQAIQEEFRLPELPPTDTADDPLAEEQDYHDRFMESRLRVYVGREKINDALLAFADGNDTVPCLVTGPSGSGKSAALARFVRDYQHKHPQTLVIPHFIGASPRSTNLRDMLRRFCLVFKTGFGFTEDVPDEVAELSITFRGFVSKVPADTRVLLVIDALNQLDDAERAQELYWLPMALPPQVKVVVSCITDSDQTEPVLEAFSRWKHCPVHIAALSDAEQRLIIHQVPSLSAKTLDDDQVRLLLSNPATANPLFLLVALEELRGFASYERLNERIAAFPREGDTVTAIFTQLVERLTEEFNRKLVERVLTLLASARRGLFERELQELVGGLEGADDLFPVLRQLRPYLFSRAGLIDFYHRNLFKAVREHYVPSETQQRQAHVRLAEYFTQIAEPIDRKLAELPWQWAQAKCWGKLYDLLTDWRFFVALWDSAQFEVRSYWTQLERDSSYRMLDGYQPVLTHLPVHARDAWRLAELLRHSGHLREAEQLYVEVTKYFQQGNDPKRLAANLTSLGLVAQAQGEMGTALDAFARAERIYRTIDDDVSRVLLAETLGGQALMLEQKGYHDRALTLHQQAERICRQIKAGLGVAGVANAIEGQARVRMAKGELQAALKLIRENEILCRDAGQLEGLQRCLGDQAVVLFKLGRSSEALAANEAKTRLCESLGFLSGVAHAVGTEGTIRESQGDYGKALAAYMRCGDIFRQIGEPTGLATALYNQCRLITLHGGTPAHAKRLFDEAVLIATTHGLTSLLSQIDLDHPVKQRSHLTSVSKGWLIAKIVFVGIHWLMGLGLLASFLPWPGPSITAPLSWVFMQILIAVYLIVAGEAYKRTSGLGQSSKAFHFAGVCFQAIGAGLLFLAGYCHFVLASKQDFSFVQTRLILVLLWYSPIVGASCYPSLLHRKNQR